MATLVVGCGFIGAYAVRDMVKDGQDVVVYDIRPHAEFLEHVVGSSNMGRMKVVVGDVMDLPQLLKVINEHRVDKVLHLAAIFGEASRENISRSVNVNVSGTINVFEAAAIAGIRRVVWTSSTAVFGPRSADGDGVIHNDSPLDPTNLYGSCKAFNEALSGYYSAQYNMSIVGLRLSAVYGWGTYLTTPPRGSALRWMAEAIDWRIARASHIVVHNGDGEMDFVYVDDVARAVRLAFNVSPGASGSYVIQGDLRPVRDVYELLRAAVPEVEFSLKADGDRGHIRHALAYENSQTEHELGYVPNISVDEGISRSVSMARSFR